jgi:Big-like domain-containing protein
LRVGGALGKTYLVLLALLSTSVTVARAQTILAWDPPLDSAVSIDWYRLYRDGVLVAEPSAASLSWPIDVSDGKTHNFEISSVHRDVSSNMIFESDATSVTYTPASSQLSDSVPPSVEVSVDQNDGSSNYQVTATANDNVRLERIELSLDTTLFATCYSSPCSAPVSIESAGSHVITAVAWDAAGNKAASASTVQR